MATSMRASDKDYSSTISREEISLPRGSTAMPKLAFLLHNLLTEEECQNLIKETEDKGYELALINIGGGRQQEMTDIRNSSRCIIDSTEYTDIMWNRIKSFIPIEFKGRKVVGLNERLRFLRYDPGEYFKPHFDGSYLRENGEKSLITFQLYLNEGFEGGETTFLGRDKDGNDDYPVIPKTGSVLIFQHDILHEGSILKKGRKYTVRTDIMFHSQTQ